jgi:hypothetical protein
MNKEIAHYAISPAEWAALQDIEAMLLVSQNHILLILV